MTTIGILHPGAMGAAVGAALAEGGHRVLWASGGRSEATAARAREAGLEDAGDAAGLLAASDVALSICPPHVAVDVARLAAGSPIPFADANAISPATAEEVAAIVGDRYVDASIIGPPPARAGTTRLYLWGAGAGEVSAVFAGGLVDARVIDADVPMAASALKMAYAAWTKGSAALLLATARTAGALGVEEQLREEWALSQPTLADRLDAAERDAAQKGWRWVEEMRQIAATFGAAGQPDGFHEAAAEVYEPPG